MDLLRVMGESAGLQLHQLRAQAIHPLPFVDGLDTKTLLKLRKDEGEAFDLFLRQWLNLGIHYTTKLRCSLVTNEGYWIICQGIMM